MYTLQDFFSTLFDDGEKAQIRVIADGGEKAVNKLHTIPHVPLCSEYKTAFPCVGINPRDGRKLSKIKNLVIDIDDGELPDWATERADVVCSRDERHHHLYFCLKETTRETYKKYTTALIAIIPGGDEHVSDPERVMRIPGFAHRKKGIEGEGYKIIFIRETIERVSIDKKFSWLKQSAPEKESLPTTNTVEYLRGIYYKKPSLGEGGGRGRNILLLGFDCHFWGIDKDAAFSLALDVAREKHNPPESDEAIKTLINNAFKYATGAFGAAHNAETPKEKKKAVHLFELVQHVREKLADWVYVHEACRLIDTKTGQSFTTGDQISLYITACVGEPVYLPKLIAHDALTTCRRIEYAPHIKDRIFEKNGITYYNSYRPNTEEMSKAERLKDSAAMTFMEHVNFIGTSPEERRALLQYFAFCVQFTGQKVDWTPLIISPEEGLGKSAFSVLFCKMFGNHNCSTVGAHKLLSGWTDFVAEKLFVVSHEVETKEEAALSELKTLITEKRVSVNAKYARTYETNNCANFLLLSNKTNAIKLEKNSRRFLVIYNKNEPKEKAYYDKLFDAFENGAGWIYEFLMAEDLKDFDAHGSAIKTEGLKMLIDSGKHDTTVWLDDQIEQKSGAFESPLVELKEVMRDVAQCGISVVQKYMTQRVLTEYMHKAGFTQREYWIHGVHKRCWFKGDDATFLEALQIARGEKPKPEELCF